MFTMGDIGDVWTDKDLHDMEEIAKEKKMTAQQDLKLISKCICNSCLSYFFLVKYGL